MTPACYDQIEVKHYRDVLYHNNKHIVTSDFFFLAYVNEYVNKLKCGTNIRLLLPCYRIHSITSARRCHPDYCDKCEPGLKGNGNKNFYFLI